MDKLIIESELKAVNAIVWEAVLHGGDGGGSYDTNGEKLNEALMKYLKLRHFDDRYTTDATVYGNYDQPTIGRIPDDGEGFIYLDD